MSEKYESIPIDEFFEEMFTPFELLELDIKGRLFTMIAKRLMMELRLNQKESAAKLGISQPRISNLLNLQHDKFSIESLLGFAFKLDFDIRIEREGGLLLSVE